MISLLLPAQRRVWHRAVCSVLLIAPFLSHRADAQSLVGNWVGVRQEIDSGFACPLPLYLQVRADSTYRLSLLDDAATAPRSTWSMSTAGRLRLDTATFDAGQVTLTDYSLRLTGAYPMSFRRLPAPALAIRRDDVVARLTDQAFEYKTIPYGGQGVVYHFHGGGRACIEHQNGDRTLHCWSVVERDGVVFISIKGNQTDCSRNYAYPWQVQELTSKTIYVNAYDSLQQFAWELRPLRALTPRKTCAGVGFQLCTNCFYPPDEQAGDFDKKGPPGRFQAIRDRFRAAYRPGNVLGQTGIVQVRCWVNCEGQAGHFTATTFGPDYQRSPLDPALTDQLLTILKTSFASGWQPGRYRNVKRPLDYVATINIRLVDGQLTDVFP